MNKWIAIVSSLLIALILTGCGSKQDSHVLKVGTIAGPETELMQVAKKVAERNGLQMDIIEFSDYVLPNTALNDRSIDANVFQHQAYLEQTIKDRGYNIVAIGKTFIYPMGIYSKRYKHINNIPRGAKIAIPNDPSNGARALLLLEKAQIIHLPLDKTTNATPRDIIENNKNIQIVELDAAQLPRALDDVDLAIINTNYALPAGLIPNRDALMLEGIDSLYANVIAVRAMDKRDPRLQQLVAALHSNEVKQTAARLFHNQAIPAW